MAGIPPGAIDAVLEVLRRGPTPMRRRAILGSLEQNGHRISLAGLNRILDHLARQHLTREGPDGVRLVAP